MSKSIEKQRFINATPERVFAALTEQAELESWFVQQATVDLRPGGALQHQFEPGMAETGQILAIAAPRLLSYSWEAFSPSPTVITFRLEPENGGTQISFSQSEIGEGEGWGNYYNGMSHGWDIHLEHLTSWLETGTCPPPGPTRSL